MGFFQGRSIGEDWSCGWENNMKRRRNSSVIIWLGMLVGRHGVVTARTWKAPVRHPDLRKFSKRRHSFY